MSREHIKNIVSIATTLGITLPKKVSMDQVVIKDLLDKIKTKLATYDPTAPAVGNAVVADVMKDKTFSNASGVGLVGTYEPPTVASLTADADATAADILSGKTAYVNGIKLTGTHV